MHETDKQWPDLAISHATRTEKKHIIKRKVLNDPDWIARTSICTHRHEMAMQREAHEMVSFLTLNYTGWPHCLWNVCLSSLNPKLYVDGIKRARCDTGLKRDRNPHLLSRPWTLSKQWVRTCSPITPPAMLAGHTNQACWSNSRAIRVFLTEIRVGFVIVGRATATPRQKNVKAGIQVSSWGSVGRI